MSNVASFVKVLDRKGIPLVTQSRQAITLLPGDVVEISPLGQWRFRGKLLSVDAAVAQRLLVGKRVVGA